jgi:periplasmic divalent cation tolerance protein
MSWQGTVERTEETLMICKITEKLVAELSVALDELHPYDVYELLVTAIDAGSPAYLAWVLEYVNS